MRNVILASLLLPLALAAGPASAEPIALDAWFQGPRVEHVSISPDARYIAMIVKEGEHSIVMVKDRTTREPARGVIAADPETDMEATFCGWSSGTRVVCRLSGTTGERGRGDYLARLVAVDIDGGNRRVLLNKEKNTGWNVVDFRTGAPELVYWHEQLDVGALIYDDASRLLGVSFESNVLGPQYIEPKMAALDTALRKQWPNRWNWVKGSSEDGKTFVVLTEGLSEPNGFYVLDTRGQGVHFDLAGTEWPGLAKAVLPITTPAVIRARSGRLTEALDTPAAGTPGKAPLVVFADGTQKGGAFEPATYFLATRGYAVLRPYFSGSAVDASWAHAPYQDWNGTLYDELMDAVEWATARPEIDASRICIVGRNSYGGYSALLAAARKDSPFKCAASLQGLSDLEKPRKDVAKASLIEDERPTGTSDEQVANDSPLRRAPEFHMPVLLVEEDVATHSARDDEGGWEMAAALAAANKPHKLLLIEDVDEQFTRAAYAGLEQFLAAHLR